VIFGSILSILLSVELGHRIGIRRWRRIAANAQTSSASLQGSIFGLTGLLIAFIFYGAGSRFENRRSLIAEEANAIGTAYLRIDLLPPDAQREMRENFRKYVRSRLAVYEKITDFDAANEALALSSDLQRKVWSKAIEATNDEGPAEKSLVLTSVNQMIDISTVRTVALTAHPPLVFYAMLALSVIVSSAVAGYAMSATGNRDWILVMAYTILVAAAIFVIIDYEYPRIGLIRIDPVDRVLMQTLDKMN
jgi:hypothetical protein